MSKLAEKVHWLQKAVEQGHAEAQVRLAAHYYSGEGIKKSETRAFELLKKAAEQGNADGQFNLSRCYYNGVGVKKNFALAAEWAGKAAGQGHAEAKKLFDTFGSKQGFINAAIAQEKAEKRQIKLSKPRHLIRSTVTFPLIAIFLFLIGTAISLFSGEFYWIIPVDLQSTIYDLSWLGLVLAGLSAWFAGFALLFYVYIDREHIYNGRKLKRFAISITIIFAIFFIARMVVGLVVENTIPLWWLNIIFLAVLAAPILIYLIAIQFMGEVIALWIGILAPLAIAAIVLIVAIIGFLIWAKVDLSSGGGGGSRSSSSSDSSSIKIKDKYGKETTVMQDYMGKGYHSTEAGDSSRYARDKSDSTGRDFIKLSNDQYVDRYGDIQRYD